MSTDNLELLDKIQYPEDLRQLPVEQLPELCAELRQDIVKELSVNPGHLASSLGVVELTVAMHYVLNTPYDRRTPGIRTQNPHRTQRPVLY